MKPRKSYRHLDGAECMSVEEEVAQIFKDSANKKGHLVPFNSIENDPDAYSDTFEYPEEP